MYTKCKLEGCEQPIASREFNLCHKHNRRFIRYGTVELSRQLVDKSKKCIVQSCERHQQANIGTCLMHYKRFKKYGQFDLPEKRFKSTESCKFCNRTIGRSGALGMCCKHYQMWKLHGNPLKHEEPKLNPSKRGYYGRVDGDAFHRKIAAQKIGRPLIKRVEVVHHIDLDKLNNDPCNLEVLTKSEHSALHHQLNHLAGQLVRAGIIKYKDRKYYFDF